jgi:hypothetical protein
VLSDNKWVKTTFFRWCDELPYFLDKGLTWDRVVNRLLKYRSFFELLIYCRVACRLVFKSQRFLVPFFPHFLTDMLYERL